MSKSVIILMSSLLLILSGCGNSADSIPYKMPQKIRSAPLSVEQKALKLYGKKEVKANSLSSYSIRQETIGVNVDFSQSQQNAGKLDMKITISYSSQKNTCSRIEYRVETTENQLKNSLSPVEHLGQIQCLDNCKYIYLLIEKSPSSVASADGVLVEAAVPVILENTKSTLAGGSYIPSASFDARFLRFEDGNSYYCVAAEHVYDQPSQMLIPIDPYSDVIGTPTGYDGYTGYF